MNEHTHLKWWKWAVILLALCNIALVVIIWVRPGTTQGHPPESPRDYVIRNLKFSDGQVKKYDTLIKQHRLYMHQFHDEAMEYRRQLFSHLQTGEDVGGNITTSNSNPFVDSLTALIAFKQRQIEQATYYHFAEVRKICTDTQKTEFDKIISDVIKKMNGNQPGGSPPGDRQGPPPNDRTGPPENE